MCVVDLGREARRDPVPAVPSSRLGANDRRVGTQAWYMKER